MPYAFPDAESAARLSARLLLEVEAVNFRPEDPYTLTSGLVSPVYVDCRRLISFPRVRGALMDMLVGRLIATAGAERFDAVAGGRDRRHPLRRLRGRAPRT
jgi:Orotate phosphoribosyltransferase